MIPTVRLHRLDLRRCRTSTYMLLASAAPTCPVVCFLNPYVLNATRHDEFALRCLLMPSFAFFRSRRAPSFDVLDYISSQARADLWVNPLSHPRKLEKNPR